ncbi:MAG: hypothetical protein GY773_08595 [Actinomycetia bacterium]|nr:hypothetical protein [Actinomycetes bacterium]
MTYEMDPAGSTVAGQNLQIAVLADFCNECGNCETACPTSGSPYKDKPRLYLDRGDFEAQNDNAFMVLGSSAIEARKDGSTHRLELNGQTQFDSGLEATMATILRGMTDSMAHVPAYTDGGTYVTHPGYSED